MHKKIKVGALFMNTNNGSWRIIIEIQDIDGKLWVNQYDASFREYVRWPLSFFEENIESGKYIFYA
jgi:hypothetical protein